VKERRQAYPLGKRSPRKKRKYRGGKRKRLDARGGVYNIGSRSAKAETQERKRSLP